MEKIIDKIRKLLAMTEENGASENEAMVAALKAQKLMAEYNLTVADIGDEESKKQTIAEVSCDAGKGDKWKYKLASIIATNFCCKTYVVDRRYIIFYGYEKDARIATDVFKFLFNTGNKLADRCYYEYYKKGESTKGVKNTYLLGFCQGIYEVLGKQCTALALVVPKEVKESFAQKMSGAKIIRNKLTMKEDTRAFEMGRSDGRSTANARSLEG